MTLFVAIFMLITGKVCDNLKCSREEKSKILRSFEINISQDT